MSDRPHNPGSAGEPKPGASPGRFILELTPVPPGLDRLGRDPAYRLRLLLKMLLRLFGFRCVRVTEQPGDAAK